MPLDAHYVSALEALYRRKPVAVLDDLRAALNTPSRTTIFRVLCAAGYLTSYSHAGRYYTLKRIPKFDSRGIWLHRGIGFSSHGTLRTTVTKLTAESAAGQTHGELQDLLQLRVHDTLRLLVRAGAIERKRFEDQFVYLSAKPEVASVQWGKRQQLAAEAHSPAAPESSQVIDVLVDFIHHPNDDAGAVASRLRALGHSVTDGQAVAIFARYGLKKMVRSRSRRSRQ